MKKHLLLLAVLLCLAATPDRGLCDIDAWGDTGVGAYPRQISVQCTGGETLNFRVEFK